MVLISDEDSVLSKPVEAETEIRDEHTHNTTQHAHLTTPQHIPPHHTTSPQHTKQQPPHNHITSHYTTPQHIPPLHTTPNHTTSPHGTTQQPHHITQYTTSHHTTTPLKNHITPYRTATHYRYSTLHYTTPQQQPNTTHFFAMSLNTEDNRKTEIVVQGNMRIEYNATQHINTTSCRISS